MTRTFATFIFLLLMSGYSSANELNTRYGTIAAIQDLKSESRIKIEFDGTEIANVNAAVVTFYRVTPEGITDYIIVEKRIPGLYCYYQYLIVTIHNDKSTNVSPSFGDCHELSEAKYMDNGIKLILTSTGPRPGKESYWLVNGELTKH